jgi:hypothetical protein
MMNRAVPFLVAGCLTLCGCDTIYGVSHVAELAAPPHPDCMRQVLAAMPGLEVSDQWEKRQLFSYRGVSGSQVRGILQVHKRSDGRYVYNNGNWMINGRPPQAEIDATRPMLRAIDAGLAERCGLIAPVRETCNGVACRQL